MAFPSLEAISSGNSILFLGAGFSLKAKNIEDEPVKSGWQLTSYLLDLCGITAKEDYELDTAAQEYIDKFGEPSLIEILQRNFNVSLVADEQKRIVEQPWHRIYTTNYDNVISRISSPKAFTFKTVSDPIERPDRNATQVVHIYGAVSKLTPMEFKSHFLLTEIQRDQSPFVHSPWFRRFTDDVLSAQALVFVGFSLRDMDLRRLLGALPSSVKAKTYFVDDPSCSSPTRLRLRQFGDLELTGIDGFYAHLKHSRPGPPTITQIIAPQVLQQLDFELKQSMRFSAGLLQGLLVGGALHLPTISQDDIDGLATAYTIGRPREVNRAARRQGGVSPAVVHSDIGNGKSVFLMQVGYAYASRGYKVFLLRREPEDLSEILLFFQTIDENCLLIADDIWKFPKALASIHNLKNPKVEIITSCRSSTLETAESAVKKRIGSGSYTSIDLNLIMQDDLRRITDYFDINGMLGDYTALSDIERDKLFGTKCGGQLRDIILTLFETGSLHLRVLELAEYISELDTSIQNLLVLSALMTIAGTQQFGQMHVVSDLTNYNGTLQDVREALAAKGLAELVSVDRAEMTFRSAALAEFILKNVYTLDQILNVSRVALLRLNKFYADDDYFDPLSRSLLKVSVYGKLHRKEITTKLESFYDDMRVLAMARRDPLFLVQRSIATMNNSQFDVSSRYVASAYGVAENRVGFDTYQIDTHHAKLLLTMALERGFSKDFVNEKKAQRLLEDVLDRRSDDLYHPISVMRLYWDIFQREAHKITPVEKKELSLLVDRAIKSVAKFPKDELKRFRSVPTILSNLRLARSQLLR